MFNRLGAVPVILLTDRRAAALGSYRQYPGSWRSAASRTTRSTSCMTVAVMGGAQETEIVGVGAAAERERNDVIDLQQIPGAAPAPAAPVHVAATAPIALPHLPPDCGRDGAAAYLGL